ncbi:MAG TPA: alpha/beta fold hydrolase [Candidatus Limnocylindria bacterium]|nr:alpha/beta fold hydrolase [Candidatus Limnocylindria bacterium]
MRSKTLTVMGLRTRVLEEGEDRRGDPVVMIHGVGGWAENWREVMDPIAQTGRRAIAFDLPGFGESEAPGNVRHFGPRDPFYPRFVVALLDALELSSAHLVGNSLGGGIAFTAAVTAPDRTRSLALVAAGGIGTRVASFLRFSTLPGIVLLSRVVGGPEQARAVLRSCFYDTRRIPESLYDEAERYGYPSFPEFVRALRSCVTLRGVRPGLRAYWAEQADRYDGPVIVIWGRQDAVLPVSDIADAKDVLPQAQLSIIEGCGHLPQVERTAEFLTQLLPFLDRAEHAAAA